MPIVDTQAQAMENQAAWDYLEGFERDPRRHSNAILGLDAAYSLRWRTRNHAFDTTFLDPLG